MGTSRVDNDINNQLAVESYRRKELNHQINIIYLDTLSKYFQLYQGKFNKA